MDTSYARSGHFVRLRALAILRTIIIVPTTSRLESSEVTNCNQPVSGSTPALSILLAELEYHQVILSIDCGLIVKSTFSNSKLALAHNALAFVL